MKFVMQAIVVVLIAVTAGWLWGIAKAMKEYR